jgi:hypothetical protein
MVIDRTHANHNYCQGVYGPGRGVTPVIDRIQETVAGRHSACTGRVIGSKTLARHRSTRPARSASAVVGPAAVGGGEGRQTARGSGRDCRSSGDGLMGR